MEDLKTFTTSIDKQGRLLLPATVRRNLSIEPGVQLVVTIQDDRISIQTRQQALRAIRKRIAELAPPGVSLADELIQERRREAANEG